MNKQDRYRVAKEQISKYFSAYYPNWRLNQVLVNAKLLENKYAFYKDIVQETKQPDDETGEATIAQEISNGLAFEIVSDSIQMIEDLFAMLNAGIKPYYFPKNVINYSAGKISNMITKNYSDEALCSLFYFPYFNEKLENEQTDQLYRSCIARLQSFIELIRSFFVANEFFYNQYKHGLTVALRFHSKYDNKRIENDKANPLHIYIAAFNSLAPRKVKSGDPRVSKMIMIPNLTPTIQANFQQLLDEDNLIRYAVPQDALNLDQIKNLAYKTRDCINMIYHNLYETVQNAGKTMNLQIPSDERGIAYYLRFSADLLMQAKNAKLFSVDHCS